MASGETILIADDEPSLRRLLRALLTTAGFRVLEASTGDEALSLLEHEVPRIAILDVYMPGSSGLVVAAAIRRRPDLEHVGVILLTGSNNDAVAHAGRTAGADLFVAKPFSPKTLLEAVHQLLRVT